VVCDRSIPVASSMTGPARCNFLSRSRPRLSAATVRGTRVRTLEQFDCRRRISTRGKGRGPAAEDAQPDSAPLGSGRDDEMRKSARGCAAEKSAHCSDPLKHRGSVWSLLLTAGPSASRHPGSRPCTGRSQRNRLRDSGGTPPDTPSSASQVRFQPLLTARRSTAKLDLDADAVGSLLSCRTPAVSHHFHDRLLQVTNVWATIRSIDSLSRLCSRKIGHTSRVVDDREISGSPVRVIVRCVDSLTI
jgi:hypothetical protein